MMTPPPGQATHTSSRSPAAALTRWRNRPKAHDVRIQFLRQLALKDGAEQKRLQEELTRLVYQIQTLIQKEGKTIPAYQRRFHEEDPRSVFYYRMLRRVGLPDVHARFAPWFLKSQQLTVTRASAKLFARLEQAFFAQPEQLSTLEQRMRAHQSEFQAVMKATPLEPKRQATNQDQEQELQQELKRGRVGPATAAMQPRERNQYLLQRAFRDCSFFQQETTISGRSQQHPLRGQPILREPGEDATQREVDKLELIPEVAVAYAPPGLAPHVRGQLESHGKHVYVTYRGRWKQGEMQSPLGVYTFADGGTYRGEWRQSLPSGAGTVVYPNGVTYTGQFECGLFHGRGVMEMARGYRYEGEFAQGQRCGQGTLTLLTTDARYIGAFYANRKHGHGVETNALGFSYTGQWRENRMCGPGKLTLSNGSDEFRDEWPMCVLGEAVRLVKRERAERLAGAETWARRLLRVRDDLRVLDLQNEWWDREVARLEREEEERIGHLKKARRDKREAEAAAKAAFLEQKHREQESEQEGSESEEAEDEDEDEEEEGEDEDEEEEKREEDGGDGDDDGDTKSGGNDASS